MNEAGESVRIENAPAPRPRVPGLEYARRAGGQRDRMAVGINSHGARDRGYHFTSRGVTFPHPLPLPPHLPPPIVGDEKLGLAKQRSPHTRRR